MTATKTILNLPLAPMSYEAYLSVAQILDTMEKVRFYSDDAILCSDVAMFVYGFHRLIRAIDVLTNESIHMARVHTHPQDARYKRFYAHVLKDPVYVLDLPIPIMRPETLLISHWIESRSADAALLLKSDILDKVVCRNLTSAYLGIYAANTLLGGR